jgi:hypothetical protein
MVLFGYACIEHGASYAAVPALEAALRAMSGNLTLAYELAAVEAENRHAEAVAVLENRTRHSFSQGMRRQRCVTPTR